MDFIETRNTILLDFTSDCRLLEERKFSLVLKTNPKEHKILNCSNSTRPDMNNNKNDHSDKTSPLFVDIYRRLELKNKISTSSVFV